MEIDMRQLGPLIPAPAAPVAILEPSVYHCRAPLLKAPPPCPRLSVCVDSLVVVHEVEFCLHRIHGELSYVSHAVRCEDPHVPIPANRQVCDG